MKARLMFQKQKADTEMIPEETRKSLTRDLELDVILDAMAADDACIRDHVTEAMFTPLCDTEALCYRQDALRDALACPEDVRTMYRICVETEKRRRDSWCMMNSQWVSSTYSSAVRLMQIYVLMLHRLREAADRWYDQARSEAFTSLLTMLREELSDAYFHELDCLLAELNNSGGMLISAGLGSNLQGVDYVLRRRDSRARWWTAPSYTLNERDDAGAADLRHRCDRAVNEVARVLAQTVDSLENFFASLRRELAFYVGCLNLHDAVEKNGMPICFPKLLPVSDQRRSWDSLYDVSLTLVKGSAVVGNSMPDTEKKLYLITGANQGGKTTFLRSLGQAQLMAQCGMFVGASACTIPLRHQIFTHFSREEDSHMDSGKLDEELIRMSRIADRISAGSLILFNESFASTNEREGSEISCQIARALVENGVEVFSVTHLYSFAVGFRDTAYTQYLRAGRLPDGSRTFRLSEGEPLRTAYGEDLYRQIFREELPESGESL